jgi:hypothetical protein
VLLGANLALESGVAGSARRLDEREMRQRQMRTRGGIAGGRKRPAEFTARCQGEHAARLSVPVAVACPVGAKPTDGGHRDTPPVQLIGTRKPTLLAPFELRSRKETNRLTCPRTAAF